MNANLRFNLINKKFFDFPYALKRKLNVSSYLQSGRKPWSRGYNFFKEDFIERAINDGDLIQKFRESSSLPSGYGQFIDERVVEYPWLISRLSREQGKLLDAGSILNFHYLVQHPLLALKEKTIVTLEPESNCFYESRVSYLFSDLRNLPLRDNWFDEVVCISTLEHIGMDNSIYSSNPQWHEKNKLSFLQAIAELKRVTQPGGKVFITVPYGKYTDFGWYQQFDAKYIDILIENFSPSKFIETYFAYKDGGWIFSDKESCQNAEGFNIQDTKYFNPSSTKDYDPDYAACSRAIAALELWK